MRRIGARSSLEVRVSTGEQAPTGRRWSMDWRECWLVLAVSSGVFLVATTELLSLFHALTSTWVRLAWLVWAAVVGLVVFRAHHRVVVAWPKGRPRPSSLVVLAGLVAIILVTCGVAWFAPPNTSDSMSYHMSRVASWAQQQSVEDYPTPTVLQLYQPPWAEFAMLHLQLLSQSDRLANFVQFASMLSALVAASFITRLLGGGPRSQLLAAVFVGALPMGVLQASSTQNDYVAALWLSAFAASVVLVWKRLKWRSWLPYAMAGASLGLAICTKGTSYFYAGPFVLLLVGCHLPHLNRATLARLTVAAGIAALINVGQLSRNELLFHAPLGPIAEEADGAGYQVTEIRWNGFLSNVVRNIGMELGTPVGPINDATTDEISWIHERLGIWMGSPLTSWPGTEFHRSTVELSLHESMAGNLLATLLIFVSVVLGCATGRLGRNRRLLGYTLAWGAGFLGFCLVLRWQPWGNRLQLPWFVLAAPVVSMVLRRRPTRGALVVLGLVLLLAATPLLQQRVPMPGRRELVVIGVAVGALVLFAWLLRRRLGAAIDAIASATANKRLGQATWLGLNLTLLVGVLPWALLNETRPLLGAQSVVVTPRVTQTFVVLPEQEAPYRNAVAQVQSVGCQQVGLWLGTRDWDYPLWLLLRGTGETSVQLEYVGVTNVSAGLAPTPFAPCAVIATVDDPGGGLVVDGRTYHAVDGSSRGVRVLLPE
jgi:hypothetical protein